MIHLANLCLFSVLLINLLGLALLTGLWLRNAWLAITVGPWLFCSLGFFIECFHGLGHLSWLWPVTTFVSIGLLSEVIGKTSYLARWDSCLKLEDWKRELSPFQTKLPYVTFLVLFVYATLWRYIFPNIDASSEKIADLSYICGFYSGETLPVKDVWYYPFPSVHYYNFQYYAAALLGRILGIEPGAAYNLSFITLLALAGLAGVGAIWNIATKLWVKLVISAGWIGGGSGVTILVHFLVVDTPVWDDFRFIGSAILNKAPLGTWLNNYQNHFIPPGSTVPLDLPGEPLSYYFTLGDYHPPMAGFYLLGVTILVMALWARGASSSMLAILGACLPWCIVADTWNLPLHVLGLGGWALYNFKKLYSGAWRYLAVGGLGAFITVYPYFLVFAYAAQAYQTKLKWVPLGFHTPPLLGVLFLLPTIGLILLALCSGKRLIIWVGLMWYVLLLFSEFFYINDVYSGSFIRFNTTLKWWPWIASGTLVTLGPLILEMKPRRMVWILALILVVYPLYYLVDLGRALYYLPRNHIGELNGSAFYGSNGERPLLDYLKVSPKGMVAEHPEDDFTNNSTMTLFSGQYSYLGWLGHEQLWRGYLPELQYRHDQLQSFYDGKMVDAGHWMRTQGIEYILWFKKGVDQDANWDKVNASLGDSYYWHEFYHEGDRRVGLWEQKK